MAIPFGITAILHQNIEKKSILINGPPRPNYGTAPNRILDTVPAGCISVRLGEKIFVRKLRSSGSSPLTFDENTTNGLAFQMSQNKNNEQLVSKVLLSPAVVDEFVKNAFETPEDLKSLVEVGLSDLND